VSGRLGTGLVLVAALGVAGCLDFEGAYQQVLARLDGGADAGEPDAGTVDAGGPDAGDFDAGVADAGELDAGAGDAGSADAGADAGIDGGWCGPFALRIEALLPNDAGLLAMIGGGVSVDEVVLLGNGPVTDAGQSYAIALRGGWRTALPDDVIHADGADARRVFGIGFSSTLLVEDAGVSVVDVCDGGPAASVTARTYDEAYFCTERAGLCRWRPDGSTLLSPEVAGTCSSISVLLDGTVVRGGATRTDGGLMLGTILWPDGGADLTPLPVSNIRALTGVSERDYDFLSQAGVLHTVRNGAITSTDGGSFYEFATAGPCARIAVGTNRTVWTWDGTAWGPATWENDAGPLDNGVLNFVRVAADGTVFLGGTINDAAGVYRVRLVPRP